MAAQMWGVEEIGVSALVRPFSGVQELSRLVPSIHLENEVHAHPLGVGQGCADEEPRHDSVPRRLGGTGGFCPGDRSLRVCPGGVGLPADGLSDPVCPHRPGDDGAWHSPIPGRGRVGGPLGSPPSDDPERRGRGVHHVDPRAPVPVRPAGALAHLPPPSSRLGVLNPSMASLFRRSDPSRPQGAPGACRRPDADGYGGLRDAGPGARRSLGREDRARGNRAHRLRHLSRGGGYSPVRPRAARRGHGGGAGGPRLSAAGGRIGMVVHPSEAGPPVAAGPDRRHQLQRGDDAGPGDSRWSSPSPRPPCWAECCR